jgi:dUTP pyrophosphatase
MTARVGFKCLPHGEGLPLPAYQSAGAAGLDLVAAVAPNVKIVLEPGARELVPTGLILQVPEGYEGQVRPRSGLALQHGITVLNAPGTIDADYRGEVGVLLVNHGRAPFEITRGMRIAQLVIAPVQRAILFELLALAPSTRGADGFGSTGTALREGDE